MKWSVLAALLAPLAGASELSGLAGRLWAAGQANDAEAFFTLDIQFHRLVLSSSGNEMFAKLSALVEAVLTGRRARPTKWSGSISPESVGAEANWAPSAR